MNSLARKLDTETVRTAFAEYPSGVVTLGAVIENEPTIMVASSFTVGVSLEPPMVLFSVQNTSSTWPTLRKAERIGISILPSSHSANIRQLASKDKTKRLLDVGTAASPSGALFITDAGQWLECSIAHEYPAGDHQVIVLEVLEMTRNSDSEPLVFHRSAFRQLQAM